MDALHQRQIDRQPAVAKRVARDVVSSATNGDRKLVLSGEEHAARHIVAVGAAHDHGGTFVDRPVPDLSRLVVSSVIGREKLASERLPEWPEGSFVDDGGWRGDRSAGHGALRFSVGKEPDSGRIMRPGAVEVPGRDAGNSWKFVDAANSHDHGSRRGVRVRSLPPGSPPT